MKPNVKFKEKYELLIVNKTPLVNICKNDSLINKINDNCILVNKIIIQVYQFVNLYLLYLYNNNMIFPNIDIDFIVVVIKTITIRNDTRGAKPSDNTKKLLDTLKKFYNDHYKQCIKDEDIMNDTKLNYITKYESIDIVKNINNNVSEHFIDYVNKFVNVSFNIQKQIKEITNNKDLNDVEKKQKKKEVYDSHRQIKKDILRFDNKLESNVLFHNWIKLHKPNIIRKTKEFKHPKEEELKTNKIEYDVCVNPQEYIKSMFYINKEIEKLNEKIFSNNEEIKKKNRDISDKNKILNDKDKIKLLKEETQIKLFQVIPQRTSIKASHITIDTSALINLVVKENISEYFNNVEQYKDELWTNNFKLNKKEFKRRNYTFNHMIKTDGVACSILLVKLKDGSPIKLTFNLQKEVKQKLKNLDKYIEDSKITEKMKKKSIVCIDPGLSDILHAVSKNINLKIIVDENNKLKVIEEEIVIKFRYTQNQRRLEIRNKKYNKIQETINKTIIINNSVGADIEKINLINFITINEIENELRIFNYSIMEKINLKLQNLENEVIKENQKNYYDNDKKNIIYNRIENMSNSVNTIKIDEQLFKLNIKIIDELKTVIKKFDNGVIKDIEMLLTKYKYEIIKIIQPILKSKNTERIILPLVKITSLIMRKYLKDISSLKILTVKEIESQLSQHSSKTSNFIKFIEYCKKKNEINRLLSGHYNQKIFRKLKFNRYTNTQKSESKMISNFKKKFGDPESCTVILGDYDKGDGNMKGTEPIINRKIRKILRNGGYEPYLINEFRTSKLCNECEEECSPFLKRKSNKPKDINKETGEQNIKEVWGLTSCKNDKCKLIHNRDTNACLNMYKIVENIYKGLGRPEKYKRNIITVKRQ